MKHLDSLKNTLLSKANNTNNNNISPYRKHERERQREMYFAFWKRTVHMWNSDIFMSTFCISSLHNVHFKWTLHCIMYLQYIQHMSCPISEQKLVISHAPLLSFSILQSGTQSEQKKDFRGQGPQPTFSYLHSRKAGRLLGGHDR